MATPANTPSSFPNRDALIESLHQIITAIAPCGEASTGAQKLDIRKLEQIERQLNNILPMLQFERLDAEEAQDWEGVDGLTQAIDACKNTLNRVRAAILRATVIPLHDHDLAELSALKDKIDTAACIGGQVQVVLSVLNLVRRLILPGLVI